jgi:hypothetical protein
MHSIFERFFARMIAIDEAVLTEIHHTCAEMLRVTALS